MQIKIVITKQNKERILRLIDQLVECEAEGIKAELAGSNIPSLSTEVETPKSPNFLTERPRVKNLAVAEPEIADRKFGSWGMFNSYVPGKAALRVLHNLLGQNSGEAVKFSELIDACITYFSRFGLYKYRGFPKKTSESARTRLAAHLIMPYHEMGLIKVYGNGKDPDVTITKDGLDFADLRNPLLDDGDKTKSLSEEESMWIKNHLKRIDGLGYKEFSLLRDLTHFLAKGEPQFKKIVDWFKENQGFVDWLKSGSRHRDDPKAFLRQLQNVSRTFASGKIALLRELGVVSSARATYNVLQNLEN